MSSDSNTVTPPLRTLLEGMNTCDGSSYTVDRLQPALAVKPGSVHELSDVLRSARSDQLSVIPWGGGTQMGVGNLPPGYDVAVDLSDINDVLRYDPDDMTMSVQAGCRLADLNRMLGEHRQVLPVDVAFPEQATIGGITAVGASGPRRFGYGPLRDLIIGMSVVSVDGVVSKAGGQVVKNVTGYDMMRMHHGALGALGVIVSVNLKVIPKPQSERTVIATYRTLSEADHAAREVVQSQLGVTALVVTNPAATVESTGLPEELWAIAVRCEAPPSAVVRQAERVSEYIATSAENVSIEESTADSETRWAAICRALDQRVDSPDVAARIGRAPSSLGEAGTNLSEQLSGFDSARITLDYGSGLAYVRIAREEVRANDRDALFKTFSENADHVTLMTAPSEMKQDNDVFGGPKAGFSMIESLKATFDPDRTLNRGRSVGRL